jgi:zinc-binding alcohol dehydrogenase/oxidoreductase
MKALTLTELNQPLVIHNIPEPKQVPGSVIVALKYAALNHRDVWIQKGLYAGIKLPIVLGSDGAGLVDNREVLINPALRWGKNEAYQGSDFEILGLPNQGTCAEYIVVPSRQIFDKPPHLTLAEAAALPLAGLTAFRALFVQAKLKKKDRVLITGIGGGVASIALRMALANGNETWVTSSKTDNIQAAVAQGAKGGAIYTEANWSKMLKSEAKGFDIVIDGSCGPSFSALPAICNPGARIAIYGGTAGMINDLNPQQLFWKQISIIGSTMGSDHDFKKMLDYVNKYQITPPIHQILPLAEANQAFAMMAAGQQNGKIIIQIKPD